MLLGDGKLTSLGNNEQKIRGTSNGNLVDSTVQKGDLDTIPVGHEGEIAGDSNSGFRETEEFLYEEDKGLNRVALA